MPITTSTNKKVLQNSNYLVALEKKAALLDELVSFIEDRAFGYLMEQTEQEPNMGLNQAKKALKAKRGL